MSSLQENKDFYRAYDWTHRGEEWADVWGGSDMQWYATILPRIHRFLPAKRIVEIGAGYGRWVPYLATYCEELMLMDIIGECIEFLDEKYRNDNKIRPTLNDGATIPGIEPKSVDLAFSFHSLVHADRPTMRSYIEELSRILSRDGAAFIHHSNAAAYAERPGIDLAALCDYRDVTMSSDVLREIANDAGLLCVSQEEVSWETTEMLDAFTVLARPMSLWGRSETRIRNPDFSREMAYWGHLARIYSEGQTPAVAPTLYQMSNGE